MGGHCQISEFATGWIWEFGSHCVYVFSSFTGISQPASKVAVAAPTICAAMKPGTSEGRMPEKVLLAARASVTAGFANDVEDVNQ
jgi:hypothetical protein